ncbi:MAG: hypothetical protein IT371_18305 [Deltaproteobacteria bacterium]|nr:hypothetical protein [Deltaproteobacteria bacterium]
MRPAAVALVGLGLISWASTARGDQIVELVDHTKIVGSLLHYYDGVMTVQLPNGSKVRLPDQKILKLHFKLPKPRPELSTPQKSFQRLRQAAVKGDLTTYVDSHSAYYQMFLTHQIEVATPPKFVKQLQQEWGSVQLEVVDTKVTGASAVMKVRRKKGTDAQEGELRFVKENSEWKMILPL